MTSSRPYLLRGLHEWILENQMTPYVVVDASLPGIQVPEDFVSNGQIVLNISPGAVRALNIGNDYLEFSARFGGVPMQVVVPSEAVMAIYAKENGQGMVFGAEPGGETPPDDDGDGPQPPPGDGGGRNEGRRPSLKIVK